MTSTHSANLMELVISALGMMAGNIPMLLAYVIAIIILITRWRQAPRAALLAPCGVLFGSFLLVLGPVLNVWLIQKYNSGGAGDITEMTAMFGVLAVASSIAHAVAFGFLFLAIYADRRQFHAPPPPEY